MPEESLVARSVTLTYRFRVKDKHAARLAAQARAVNFVWNYCNETQMKAAQSGRQWLNWIALDALCAGATKAAPSSPSSTWTKRGWSASLAVFMAARGGRHSTRQVEHCSPVVSVPFFQSFARWRESATSRPKGRLRKTANHRK